VFSSLNAPWYVFGAQAAIVWGRPRLTAAVDVTERLWGKAISVRSSSTSWRG
jgi:hypothetical protein